MPKNVQYGRLRRIALQVVLWVIFGSTLALAGYISHRRTAPLRAELGEPVAFGSLVLRPPKDWKLKKRTKSQPMALIARERDEDGRQRRELRVTQERQVQVKKGPAFYLETTLKLPDARPEPFEMLGARGALIEWRGFPHNLPVELEDMLEDKFPDPGLYACAVLRDGTTVTLQLRGQGAYGPTSFRLLRKVADSMKLSDTPPPTTLAIEIEEEE